MLTRIAVALTALYLVSNHADPAGDARDLAARAGSEASRSALAYCLDHPEPCRKVIGTIANTKTGETTKTAEAPRAAPKVVPNPARDAELAPGNAIATDAYPLPPRRPASKKA